MQFRKKNLLKLLANCNKKMKKRKTLRIPSSPHPQPQQNPVVRVCGGSIEGSAPDIEMVSMAPCDDMNGADDVELSGDDCCSDDGGLGWDDDDDVEVSGDDDYDGDYVFGADDLLSRRQQNYSVLSEAEIRQLQEEDITRLSNVLSIPRVHSCILLCHYKWNASKVHDEWFADEVGVRKTVGLVEQQTAVLEGKKLRCNICFDSHSRRKMRAAACGHQFCAGCWRGYISTSINDGPGCLTLRCPEPSCECAVGHDMINIFTSDEDKEKYSHYFLRSYVENNKKTKWCPAPGCEFAVNFDMASSNFDVCCKCTHSFCWNCAEEAHRPVVCETVAKWIIKNSAESENTIWILANSKPCPKCKRPIEKNHGCMHMTCGAPCRFEFCWLCLGAWSEHGRSGFYSCNRYEKARKEGKLDEDEKIRERAKHCIERYTHYFERWATNQSSKRKAQVDLHNMQTKKLEELSVKLSLPKTQLNFIVEAWEQIVECRRVLKWTFAYGYYLPVEENAKRELFEYLQGEAESGLERLHACVEKELQVFFESELSGDSSEFTGFRAKLVGLTSVTHNYFENLVRAFETGLKEVGSPQNDQGAEQSSSSKSQKKKHGSTDGAETSSSPRTGVITEADYENWICRHCTYINNNKTSDECEACLQPR